MLIIIAVLFIVTFSFFVGVKTGRKSASSKVSKREGAKLAKATPSEQADLDWLNSF